jgi:hypothetical protein
LEARIPSLRKYEEREKRKRKLCRVSMMGLRRRKESKLGSSGCDPKGIVPSAVLIFGHHGFTARRRLIR